VEAGKIDPDETTVAYITGNGLKTQERARLRLDDRRSWIVLNGR